jgi:transposase
MKKSEEVMEILEAYDLTGSFRQAAALVGCDHKTVGYWVRMRDEAGGMPVVERARPAMEAVFVAKIDELVDRSRGKIRADAAHGKLVALGYQGSPRTTRRWVADSKRRWRQKHGRRTRPWIPEPGLWMQWDYADGPTVQGRATVLFCAWLAWSRFRVVVALLDKTLASVVLGLDRSLRVFGGCPTYALTDNEKTVTVEHVCGIAVRHPTIVEVSRHYGLTIATCEPADPQSKGGSEATVRVAKADLVPTAHNLRDEYEDFAALERACEEFMRR